MTTVSELEDRILHPMRDSTQDMFPEAELIDYMNTAITDLCARERLFRDTYSLPGEDGVFPLPSFVLQVRWLRDPQTHVEVAWMDESTWNGYRVNSPNWSDDQSLATIYSDAIHVHPIPLFGEFWELGYYGLPEDVMSGPDWEFPLRRIWEEKVVRYAQSECWYKLGENEMGDRARAFYEEGLRPAQGITDTQIPGRLNFSREPNVFDRDSESVHRGG